MTLLVAKEVEQVGDAGLEHEEAFGAEKSEDRHAVEKNSGAFSFTESSALGNIEILDFSGLQPYNSI